MTCLGAPKRVQMGTKFFRHPAEKEEGSLTRVSIGGEAATTSAGAAATVATWSTTALTGTTLATSTLCTTEATSTPAPGVTPTPPLGPTKGRLLLLLLLLLRGGEELLLLLLGCLLPLVVEECGDGVAVTREERSDDRVVWSEFGHELSVVEETICGGRDVAQLLAEAEGVRVISLETLGGGVKGG